MAAKNARERVTRLCACYEWRVQRIPEPGIDATHHV